VSHINRKGAAKTALTSVEFWYGDGELHVEVADDQGNVQSHYGVPCASQEEAMAIKQQLMGHLRGKGIRPLSDGGVQ
jgi:hypothetical protein